MTTPAKTPSLVDKIRRPGQALEDGGKVSASAVLKAVGIDPTNPVHQAAMLAADSLGLSMLRKEVIVIPSKGVYIARDGYLALAHRSRQLDGIEVLEEWESETHWHARVAVHRKDMARAIVMSGRYAKSGANKAFGVEMAVTRAERNALMRAFYDVIPPDALVTDDVPTEAAEPTWLGEASYSVETGELLPAPDGES